MSKEAWYISLISRICVKCSDFSIVVMLHFRGDGSASAKPSLCSQRFQHILFGFAFYSLLMFEETDVALTMLINIIYYFTGLLQVLCNREHQI